MSLYYSRLEAQLVSNTVGVAQMSAKQGVETAKLKQIQYYWGTNPKQTGEPAALFRAHDMIAAVMKMYDFLNVEGSVFWPNDGITILHTSSVHSNQVVARTYIMGQLVKSQSKSTPSAETSRNGGMLDELSTGLAFDELCTVIVSVDNPEEAPNFWNTEIQLMPHSMRGGNMFWDDVPQSMSKVHGSVKREYVKQLFMKKLAASPQFRWLSFASSSGKSYALETDYIYILGSYNPIERRSSDKHTFDMYAMHAIHVIGRISASNLLNNKLESIEVLSSDSNNKISSSSTWASIPSIISLSMKPVSIIPLMTPEASLYFDSSMKKWVIVTVVMLSQHFTVCFTQTSNITSAWTCVHDGYTAIIPPWSDDMYYNVYAGRAHMELISYEVKNSTHANNDPSYSKSLSMVTTYIPNSRTGPGSLLDPMHYKAYLPKFVHLKVQIN